MSAIAEQVSAPLLDEGHLSSSDYDAAVADMADIRGVAVLEEDDIENPSLAHNERSPQRAGPMEVAFRLLCVSLVVVQTARMGFLVQDRVQDVMHGSTTSVSHMNADIQFLADHSEPSVTREAWELESEIPWPWGNHTHHHNDTKPDDKPDDKPSDDPTSDDVYKSLKDFKNKVDKGFGTATLVSGIIAGIFAIIASLDMCCKVLGARSIYWAKESVVYVKAKRKPIMIALGAILALAIGTTCAMWIATSHAVDHPEKKRLVPTTMSLFVISRTLLNVLGLMALGLLTIFYSCGAMFVQGSRALGKTKHADTKAWRMKLYMEGMNKARPDISPRIMSLYRRGFLVEA